MRLIINDDIKLQLPIEYDYEQRLSLVNNILEKYKEYLTYDERMFDQKCGTKKDINALVKYRLSALATYLITSEEDCYSSKDVMSDRKADLRRKSEVGCDNELFDLNQTYRISI